MHGKKPVFLRSIYPLIGSVIGVGIFGLPYVFAQSGFFVGIIHLIILAVVNGVILLTFGDIVMNTKGHSRYTGIVKKYLGEHWSLFGTVLMFGSAWGAMIAYIIIGGSFLHALLVSIIPISLFGFQLVFFLVSSFLLIGGLGFISKLESVFVVVLLLLITFILAGAAPHVQFENLQIVNLEHWFLPFGVVLFAFGGLSAVPEMADILGARKHLLRRSILTGLTVITLVYIAFSGVIVSVTGTQTSPEAISGLGEYVGNWVVILGALVGLIAVFTSFLILGISVTDTLVFDFKRRYMTSWAFTIIVPFIIFILGARDFIQVIGFTGAVLGGGIGLLTMYLYIKAKSSACLTKRCLRIPNLLLVFTILVLLFGLIATIFGIAN